MKKEETKVSVSMCSKHANLSLKIKLTKTNILQREPDYIITDKK